VAMAVAPANSAASASHSFENLMVIGSGYATRRHGVTRTPFQNATRPRISFAASFGSA
jgi:hypothetical protein